MLLSSCTCWNWSLFLHFSQLGTCASSSIAFGLSAFFNYPKSLQFLPDSSLKVLAFFFRIFFGFDYIDVIGCSSLVWLLGQTDGFMGVEMTRIYIYKHEIRGHGNGKLILELKIAEWWAFMFYWLWASLLFIKFFIFFMYWFDLICFVGWSDFVFRSVLIGFCQ